MRKYLGGLLVLAFILSASSAFADAVAAAKVTGFHATKWFRLTATITDTTVFTVNVFTAAGADLGELASIGEAGLSTLLGTSANGDNLPLNMNDGTNNTHLRVHAAWDGASYWSVHLLTDNSTFEAGTLNYNDKGGLIRTGATNGGSNRMQVLYHAFANPTPGTLLTPADTAAVGGTAWNNGWRWIQDANNSNFLTGSGLGDSQIAYGTPGGLSVNEGALTPVATGGNFAVNIAGIVNNQVPGAYVGTPNLVLRAQ